MSAITWADVPMRYWATRVTDFNTEVDRLVAELAEQSQTAAADHEERPRTRSNGSVAPAVADAQASYRLAEATYITADRDTTIAMIRQGPTPENLAAAAAGPTYEDDQIDYVLTRGVDSYGTELVDGAESDHDGIGVTVDLDG